MVTDWEAQKPLHEGCPMDDSCDRPECEEMMRKFWAEYEPNDETCEDCREFPCVCAFNDDEYGYEGRLA